MRFGTQELLIILVIVVLVIGPTQIPKLSKMFGKASRKFKEGLNESDEKENAKDNEKDA